jgi:5-methyltetrahydropteroyltriglutamate--homocysteine methyltransferase
MLKIISQKMAENHSLCIPSLEPIRFRQDFPLQCVSIRGGEVVQPVDAYVSTIEDSSARPEARSDEETAMTLPTHLFPTTVVGSYPQPEWLVDHAVLSKSVPRTRMRDLWRLPEEHLEEAQNDATIVAIRDMERAGIDIVTDGEIRRESYSNRFATALEGVDTDNPAIITSRAGLKTPVPRVVGKIRRTRAVELSDMEFLRRNTDRAAKITLPGPFTMSQQAGNEFYKDDEELAMAFAEAVNAEARDLEKAGADVIQLDEPWVRSNPDLARRYAVKAINRALEGLTVPTVVHLCFGYAAVVPGSSKPAGYSFLAELADTSAKQISIEAAQPKLDLGVLKDLSNKTIMLGVLDLGDPSIETTEVVAARIRNGLKHVPAERLVLAPDCGMKYMPRATAFGKLKAMTDAAALVRKELG